ncbi:TetR/AcrR family transcriptional regulator [Kibdelosporangium persicum]|uniref:HTH-type transcriptional regulator TtgR n=1 Tax=Kibdelosporangium persicum TaxID=2698649 RepID=A0ABX2F2I5_9PSEU|nr:TetR/AcrR family transcriptional regulator [Kibdelosporangium persicum]NRN65433.1 HTH-type transcriptional regulator TtgR [Kibdelosporangium persicum]
MQSKSRTIGRDGPSFIEVARRAQIVECAIETIAAIGYAQASLNQIAERAGISKSVISYHFAGKDELIQQVLTDVSQAGAALIWPRVQAETTSAGMLRAYIQSHLDFMRDHPKQVAAVSEILLYHRAQTTAEHDTTPLEERLRQGQRDGEFRTFSPRLMAWTIRAALDEVARQYVADPSLDLDEAARELARNFALATTAHTPGLTHPDSGCQVSRGG